MKKVLTIAGSDSSGGAGIQADLKTFSSFGVWGLTAITSLTAQNTEGVLETLPIDSKFLYKQIEAVVKDIKVDAVKIGMLLTKENVVAVSNAIQNFKLKNIVLDPVILSKNGKELLSKEALKLLKEYLIPKVDLITPNIPEAETLTNLKIKDIEDMEKACLELKKFGVKSILLKGGHLESSDYAVDILYLDGKFFKFSYPYVKGVHPKGTGCTLSSAIASLLAKGFDIKTAVEMGKIYISGAIKTSFKIGKGNPVLNFNFPSV